MAKSKDRPEKKKESTAEFIKRRAEMKKSKKRNGLKRQFGRHHR